MIDNSSKENEEREDEIMEEEISFEKETINNEEHPIIEKIEPTLPSLEEVELQDEDSFKAAKSFNDEVRDISSEQPLYPEKETPVESQGRLHRVFRHGIRWTVGVLIIFGLGLLAGIFLLYRPALQEAENTALKFSGELDTAKQRITELEDKISNLNNEITSLQPLREKNQELVAENQRLRLHIAILDARVDVSNAQLALEADDNAQARVMLNQTSQTLIEIHELLNTEQKDVVDDLKQRLDLVMDELDDDPFAAKSDLDVLETKLLQLEDALFGE